MQPLVVVLSPSSAWVAGVDLSVDWSAVTSLLISYSPATGAAGVSFAALLPVVAAPSSQPPSASNSPPAAIASPLRIILSPPTKALALGPDFRAVAGAGEFGIDRHVHLDPARLVARRADHID